MIKEIVLRRFQYDVLIGGWGSVRNAVFAVTTELSGIEFLVLTTLGLVLYLAGLDGFLSILFPAGINKWEYVAAAGVTLVLMNYALIRWVGIDWIEHEVKATPPEALPEIKYKAMRDLFVPAGAFAVVAITVIAMM